jgi:hypothetical protein
LIDTIIDYCPLSIALFALGAMAAWVWDAARKELDRS